ncbi:tbc1 domain-containingfamily member 14 [Trichoderma arundinaceum]|uniref:Tbc1 domain-containingfamily member 14 n=1 Tax=Trichoderma arundinaceum TaxID=490622 RepID=A0A395NWP2_TRIAR|nr:tbc1 domain-containingfamily member 14 [Trichoderma arundinaceum]
MIRDHGVGIGIINGGLETVNHATIHGHMSPDSPPGMTASKSSKSSSFHSLNSDDASVLADVGHFEDIGLGDDGVTQKAASHTAARPPRNLASAKRAPRPKRSFPNLNGAALSSNPRSTTLTTLADPRPTSTLTKGYSTSSVPQARRHRSISPAISLNPKDPSLPARPRRGSWQVSRDRKSISELEQECDDDDDDDIPDGLFLENVPISPRPAHERPASRPPSVKSVKSISPSPERRPKNRVRSVGNGTPPVAQAHGSLRSPSWKTDGERPPPSPLKGKAHSWNVALSELNADTKALTEKLEEHLDEQEEIVARRHGATARPNTWNPSQSAKIDGIYDKKKDRVKSSFAELPPLRRSNIMIDPLPISKEKEAVLSRTRPSWLPPKDPAEERRHLREYQKMMTASVKAEERREAARKNKADAKDNNADKAMHIWEDDILPRWNQAIREKKTRELWWKGVAPRSRRAVWAKAIGNELGLTEASFRAALARSEELEQRVKTDRGDAEDLRRVKWFEQIRKDVGEKTWRELRIFEVTGPLHQGLVDVLRAYAMYRNDIGYVPGCNTIAALLLLNLPNPETTFIALANVLNRPLPLSFYTYDRGAQASAYNLVFETLKAKSSSLYEHLTKTVKGVQLDHYLANIFTNLFTGHLAIDEAARLWDVYVFEGDTLLVRAVVALLLSREMDLLVSKTAEEVKTVLAKTTAGASSTRALSEVGAEDRFIQSVRDIGKL